MAKPANRTKKTATDVPQDDKAAAAELARLSAEIARAEAAIDTIVYGLFDLTAAETGLLEASIA